MQVSFGSQKLFGDTLVYTAFMLFLAYGYLYYNFVLMGIGAGIALLIAISGHRHLLKEELSRERLIILILLLVLTLTLPFALSKALASVYHYTIAVTAMMAAYVVSRNPESACSALGFTLFISQGIVVLFLLTTPVQYFPLDEMIPQASSNGITSYLCILQAVYVSVLFQIKRKTAILSSAVTLYICIEGYGRGSIVAAILICAATLMIYSLFMRGKHNNLVIFGIVCGLIGYAIFQKIDIINLVTTYLMSETKLGHGFTDVHREAILTDYLGKMNFLTVFIGADFNQTVIVNVYNGNPHSSIIRAHHLFGLFYLLALVAVIVIGIRTGKGWRGRLVASAMTIVIIFRSFSEPLLFPTALDFFVFLFLFLQGAENQSLSQTTGRSALGRKGRGPPIPAPSFGSQGAFRN